MTNKEIHDLLKDNLIKGIVLRASKEKRKTLIIPGTPWIDYESPDNGWCYDQLGAVTADTDAFFVEEGSRFPKSYDWEEDKDCIISAYMNLDNIMLEYLANIAESLKICETTVKLVRKFIKEIEADLKLLPDTLTAIPPVEINVADEDSFWRYLKIEEVSSRGVVDPFGNFYEWEKNVPIDDRCRVIDHLKKTL